MTKWLLPHKKSHLDKNVERNPVLPLYLNGTALCACVILCITDK